MEQVMGQRSSKYEEDSVCHHCWSKGRAMMRKAGILTEVRKAPNDRFTTNQILNNNFNELRSGFFPKTQELNRPLL
jgi:hypothetical protein